MTTRLAPLPAHAVASSPLPTVTPLGGGRLRAAVRLERIGDVTIACHETGDAGPGARTVVLFHGSPAWSYMYRHLVTALREHVRVIAVDLPGLGLSEAPRGHRPSLAGNALLFDELLRRLDVSDATLVVHATAGPSALWAAAGRPGSLRSLVICNSFAWDLYEQPAMKRMVQVVSSRPFGWWMTATNLLGRVFAARGAGERGFDEVDRRAYLRPLATLERRRQLASILRSLRTDRSWLRSLPARLERLRALPTLLVFGEHDNGRRAGSLTRFQRLLPKARSRVIAGAAHFPMEERPEEFVDTVAPFVLGSGDG